LSSAISFYIYPPVQYTLRLCLCVVLRVIVMVSTTTTYPKDLEARLNAMPDLPPNDRSIVERAYHRAEIAHDGQKRKSGEPYFIHCVAVASILAELRLDAEAIAAGLLHDVVEDTTVTEEDLKAEFGTTISKLVDGVT